MVTGNPYIGFDRVAWKQLKYHPIQAALSACTKSNVYVTAGRGAGKCLAQGTLVSLADGVWCPIESVKAGDLVLSLNEQTWKIEPKRVSHVYSNGVRSVLRIKLIGRELLCTKNHPLLVNGHKWVEAGDVRVGDLVAVPKALPQFGTKKLNQDELDFLAIWLAEGASYSVSNQTPEIVDIVYRVAKHWGLDVHHSGACNMYLASGDSSGKRFSTHKARLVLEKYGLWGKNSKTKFIPDIIFQLTKKQIARFLNLFFACDGYCCPKGTVKGDRVAYTIGTGLANKHLVKQIAALLLKFGVRGVFRFKHHKDRSRITGRRFKSWHFETSDSQNIIRFADEIGMLAKEKQINAARKAAVASKASCSDWLPISEESFKDRIHFGSMIMGDRPLRKPGKGNAGRMRVPGASPKLIALLNHWRKQNSKVVSRHFFDLIRPYSDGSFDALIDGDVAWEKVTAIVDKGERETYDLTVEDNHNFIAEGVITHNSEHSKRKLVLSLPLRKPWGDPRYFYAGPTYQQVKRIAWREFLALIPKWWIPNHGASASELCIRTIWGSELWLIGLDKPQRMEGSQYDGGVIDECSDINHPTADRAIRPALTWRNGWLWKIGVPKRFGIGAVDFKSQFRDALTEMEEERKTGKPSMSAAFTWSAEGVVPQAALDYWKAKMDPADYAEQFRAFWQEIGGGIYHNFSAVDDYTGNVRPCKYRPDLPIIVGSDFNVNPMAWTLAHIVDGHLEVFDELHLQDANTYKALDTLWTRYGTHRKSFEFYGDATGRGRRSSAVMSDYKIIFNDKRFQDVGRSVHYLKSNPAQSDRFATVNALICNGIGERRLFVDPSCKHLIEDYTSRQFKPGTRELPANEGRIGHHADSADYICCKRFPLRMNIMSVPEVVLTQGLSSPGGYQGQSQGQYSNSMYNMMNRE